MGEWNNKTPFSGYPIEVRTSGVSGTGVSLNILDHSSIVKLST